MKNKYFTSIGYIICLLILLLNDFYLKIEYPGLISGKLSDVTGLFIFPLFLYSIVKKYKTQIYIITAVFFVIWKLPISNSFFYYWNTFFEYKLSRIVDYSDFYTLLILPISYFYDPQKTISLIRVPLKFVVFGISLFAFISSGAGAHGHIYSYRFEYSKSEVNNALNIFFQENKEYIVPKQLSGYTWHYGSYPSEDEWINKMNSDSVSFHFFWQGDHIPKIIWTSFENSNDNWKENSCQLMIIGVVEPGREWIFDKEITETQKQNLISFFNENIYLKITNILLHKLRT